MLWASWLGLLVASTQLKEALGQDVPVLPALGIRLADEDLQKGVIAGPMYIRSPTDFSGSPTISYFSVYWGSDASTKLVSQALVSVNVVSDTPLCSGTACSSITFTPDSTTPTTFIISRGENGYSNQERAEILLVRGGTVTLTFFDTESYYDTLTIGGQVFSGSSAAGEIIEVSAGSMIIWDSDYSVTGNGWTLTFQSHVAAMQQVNISSTTIPAGASHFLVYSGNANGEMASPLSAPIRDMYVLPSPLSLSFTDSSSTTHFVSGLLQLGEPSDVSDILRYDVYWGNHDGRWGACSATIGYRFEPGPNLTRECSGNWGSNFLSLLPIAAESVAGPEQVGGFGLRFDGSFSAETIGFMVCLHHACYDDTADWSIAAWINPSVQPAQSGSYLLYKGSTDYGLFVEFSLFLNSDFTLSCGFFESESVSCTSTQALTRNTWTHALCTRETAGSVTELRLYLNGALSMSCTSQLATTWRTYGKLVIGGGLPGQADDTFFDGLLDEVAIFEYSLTAAEVSLLYNGDRLSTWLPGETTSMQLNTAPRPGATTLVAVSVGEFVESEPLVIPLVDLATPVNLPLAVSFTDTDPTAGSYGGVVLVTRASDESDLSRYVAYWGSSATTKLTDSLELGDVDVANESSSEVSIHLPAGLIPPGGANHILVVSSIDIPPATGESSQGVGVLLSDYAPPSVTAQAVSFSDTNPVIGTVSGNVLVTGASNENGIVSYNLYFADSTTPLELIVKLPVASGTLSHTLTDVTIPANANSILVLLEGTAGEAATGVSSTSLDALDAPSGIEFQDLDPLAGTIQGVVTIQRAVLEVNVQSYEVYWAQGSSQLQLLQSLPLSSLPVTLVMEMYDSFGDGWNGADYNIYGASGTLLASGTLSAGSEGSASITDVPAAETLSITITEGSWPSEVSWILKYESGGIVLSSDGSQGTFPVNFEFTISGSTGGTGTGSRPFEVEIAAGTTAPAGADTLLAFCAFEGGASLAATTPLVDWSPPSGYPTSLAFSDTDGGVGIIAGQITVGRATDETGISEYKIYFGTSSSSKVPSAQAIASISTSVDPLVATLPATTVPTGASYLLAFSSSSSGENPQMAFLEISDLQRPTSPPSNVIFTDIDPVENSYAGLVSFSRAQDEAAITDYRCYWGSSSSAPDFRFAVLGSVAVSDVSAIQINSTEAPAGMTHLVVVSANGAYSMSTGSGVLPVDYATVTVIPSSFEFLDTDVLLGSIGGVATIGAASDESSVVDYAVYWGLTSTVKMPGGSPGLNAEFFTMTSCPATSSFVDFSTLGSPYLTRHDNVSQYSSSRPGGSFSTWPGLSGSELFAARWTGWIQVISAASYWIEVVADDQSKLFVDGVEATGMFSEYSVHLTSGFHEIELQYFQCFGSSYLSALVSGPDTNYMYKSLWSFARTGVREQAPVATAPKTGSTVAATIPGTAIPVGATYLVAFARAAGGLDSVFSIGTDLVDLVKPSVTAGTLHFSDADPSYNMIQGVLTIGRAQDETNLNFYKVYWGSSETQIVDSTTRRLQASGLGLVPSCSGVTCPQIAIDAGTNANEWIVSRGTYGNNEQAFITLTGPAEVEFTMLSTETCCDKLFFPNPTSPVSGYTTPSLISLRDGVHSIEWYSDYSIQGNGWSFVYRYLGSASNSPGLVAMIPKPSTAQALAVLIEQQAMAGTHFIVKTAYDSTESDNSVAIEVVDLAPPVVTVGEVTFVDTNHAAGVISGSVTIAAGSSEITGYNVYWGRDSNNTIAMGNPGLLGEYFYLSNAPFSMPTFPSSPDVVQVEVQLDVAETTTTWPGLTSSELFAARWTGFIDIATSGTYSFTLSSNDGSQLYVNDALIVDNDGVHEVQSVTSEGVYLLPGLQSLQVLFFNAYGSYSIRLEYNGPDTSNYRQAVPSSVLRHGSLSNALIGSVAAASGESVFQIQDLEIPQEASHILVRGSTAAGEGASSSSVVIRDAFPPTETASAVHFTDVDPAAGQISGSIVLEVAANQSSISHYVIYWGSSATSKLGSNPLVQLSASASSSGRSCGVKGPDLTPLRVSRRGVNGPKIVNGQTATECEWRWQASLRYSSSEFHFCGGTLIAPRWVMTAAHCTQGAINFVVTLGDFNKDSSEGVHARSYEVLRVINHHNYDSGTMTHDFALIELNEEVEMGDCVATACLPEAEVAADQECFITGWGTLSSGGSTPSELQEGMVRIVSNGQCNAGYAGEILADMLCAQGTAAGGIVDACQGDSGGPLVCAESGRYVLHGATSWGYGCAQAQYPGVWARISYVMPWIIEQTGIEPGVGGNITYNISSQSIPSSATHLLVYTAMNGVEMTTGISIPLVDFAPVQAVPASISFTDTNASPGELGGTITLGRAADESQVVGYAVYWGTASTVFGEILQVPKGSGGDVELQLPANTMIPSGATHLLGFVTSISGPGFGNVSVQITDLDASAVPGGLTFEDTDPAAMEIGGTVTVQRAATTTGITAYNLYFSSGSCTSLAQIVSLPGSGGGSVPNCLEGNACSSITISEEMPGTYSISRGMGGYENNEHAIIQVHGPGTVEFTRFDTESGYDTLRVEEATFSGTDLPGTQMLGEGMKVIEWYSDFSVTGQGWALAFTPESTFGDIIYNLPSGTAIPSGANSMMVVSQTTAGETDCASTALVDFAPPSVAAQALWFTDENPSAGLVAGSLTILQARSHDGVLEYRVYWGMNSTTPMAGSSVLFAVPATVAGTNLTVTLTATSLPGNASHLLAFSASAQGQSLAAASAEVMDYAPAQDSAQGVSFTDVDPRVGFVAGTADITRALDESTIEYYNLYFSSGQSKISFIGFMQAESLTARPSCSGLSCSQITITEVAGKYQVSRGTSTYGTDEFASIQVSGPGRVLFTYLNTEQDYDFVTILGISYSGTEVPPEISIPSGTIEITWRSDYSVSGQGWEFIYESLRFDNVGIRVPPSALPVGATDLLVISNSSGGEMASGVTTPLVDYNPPAVVPHSVECQDNDNSIGFIEGTCTITRASDETGASSYEIFWGNATHPLSATLGSVALAGASGSFLTVSVSRFAVEARASHLLALAAGSGGVAATGASTALVDNIGLALSVESVEVLGTPNSITNRTITVTSENSNDVILNIQLDLEDGSATSRVTEEDGVSFSESAPSSSMPSICLEGGSRVAKSRLIFKMKGAAVTRRRLEAHARKLESRHGAKVKSFPRLGGLGVAEMKNASVESYCRLFTELDHDPLVDFVEEDQTWHAIGNSIQLQPEYDLFPPGGKVPVPEVSRRGHMHRRAPQCHLGGCEGGKATHPNDDSYDELWGLHQDSDFDIDAPEAWNIHKGLSGQVIVAVIDTGVDYNHEDLRNQMWRNPGEIPGDGIDNDGNGFVDDVYGYDFADNDGDPMDTNGHGTHCAGTIGAEGGNSIGVVGVTWKPQIMALKFLGANGGSTSDAIRAIDYAVEMGAHLTSNSWGGGGYSHGLVAAIEAAAAANQLFIVAAGNDGQDNEVSPMYPCNYNLPNMICVASTDSDGDLSSFSNWGINVVHIAAPGSRIHSTYLYGDYQSLSGTSMATPHVAGVAALLLDYIPSLEAAVLKQLILGSAVRFSKFSSKVSTGAHLNAHAALVMASQYSWIQMSGSAISAGNITIPAQSSTAINLRLGGTGLDHGEYRARLRMSGTFNGVVYTQIIPILYTVHDFAGLPVFGAAALQFEDTDGRRQMISGALTVTRATPEQEATFSQYHIFWAGSAQSRLSDVPLAALDTGNVLHDNFATFDPSFWSGPNGEADSGSSFGSSANWSVSNGAAVFSSQYPHAHLTLARRFAPPFTVRTKVKKTTGALAQMVVEIGGSSANLFGQGGIRAVFFGSQKVLIAPEGQHESVPCTLGTWFEVTIIVLQNSVTFQDNQGCATIVKTLAITEATKSIRIGADCTGECASAGGSVWDYFEISGGLYATFNVPENTAIPVDATGFVAHGWNVLGLSSTSLYLPLSDHRVANRASQPTDVQGSSATTSSLTVSWTRGGLNDCTGFFMRYEVVTQSADSTWVDAAGCQGLVSQTAENCVVTGLTSDTPYQFRVRVLCSLEETQSLWSEISAAAVTLPLPAVAPTQLRVRLPGSSTLLVSWQSGLLNDCEFVESLVEGQQVGQATWFQPQGCTGLTLLNAYHCTAEALTAGTQYVFRVKTSCADPRSSSSWSATSIPESTLETVQAWESNIRRLISINIASDLDYSQVASNADAFKSSIATQTANALSVDASQVKVEIMAGAAASPDSGRRLAEVSVVFAVTVEGASQGESETSNQVIAGVATAVEAETGSASTLSVASTSTLTPAIAPEKITWSYFGDGRLQLNWKPLPLGDCSFLAWHVLVNAGGPATLVSGCTNLMNLSRTECVAAGMDGSQSNTFTVGVLCANPAANSVQSEASDAWPIFASTTGASGSGSGQPTTTTVPVPVLCETIASLSSVGASEVSQKFADQLELQVTTALSPCAADPNVQLKTSWQYLSTGWISLEAAGLVDSSPLPNTLRFPAFTLLPGSHQFRAVLENGGAQLDTVTFLVVVTDSVPSFQVTGASVIGTGCGIQLQVQKTGVKHPDALLAYSWSCLQAGDAGCSSISNFAEGEAKSRRIDIPPEETPVGSYTFRATVTKIYAGNVVHLPSLSASVEVTVKVEEAGPLPVEITAPWSSSQRISQQVSELWFPIMAHVGGVGSDCKVPTSAVFKWVIAREADDRIMASVYTLVSSAGASATVTSLGFEGNSLTPSTSYVYAILRADNSETLAAGVSSESLQAAAALGISVTKSLPFIVDAGPTPGSVEILPLQGQALKTSFSFSTNGWVDEDVASLQYAFFVFPVGDSYTVSLGENGELQSTPPFQPPTLNFDSANNPAFWSKMDGLMLRSSATSPTVSQRLSSKAFFTVVRATDKLGATASTTILGPLVETPSDVSQEDLTNALAESQNSGDPSQILASVQVVMSVSGDTGSTGSGAVANAALDALAGVTEIVEGDDQTLQQLGDSVSQVVATGTLDTESLKKAADILDSCLNLATGSGLSVEVGSSILGGIATIGKTTSTATTPTGEAKSVSTKLVSLVSNLGEAALGSIEPGQTKEINSVDESGEGIKVAVSKPSTAEAATSGLQLKQLSIAAEAFAGRRLDGLCGTLSVQVTEWLKSNPFSYTEEVLGTTASVSEKADVLSVEINYCNRSALTRPISVAIPMPDFGDSDLIPTCARFDKAADSWVTSDVETKLNATVGTVTCSSGFTVTSYTVFGAGSKPVTTTGGDEETDHSPLSSRIPAMVLGCLVFLTAGV